MYYCCCHCCTHVVRNYTHFDLLLLFLLFCCSADVYYVYYCISEHQVGVVCVWHMCVHSNQNNIYSVQIRNDRDFHSLSSTIYSVYISLPNATRITTPCVYVPFDFYLLHKTQQSTFYIHSLYLLVTFFYLRSLSVAVAVAVSLSVVVVCECECVLCFFPAYYASLNVWEHTKATRIYLFNPIANYWRTCLLVAMFAQVLFVC